jgi:hypothetical protein
MDCESEDFIDENTSSEDDDRSALRSRGAEDEDISEDNHDLKSQISIFSK